MLHITRRAGEKIRIGDDTIIEIVEITGSHVRVSVQAPKSVPVYREELWETVQEENRAAAKAKAELPTPATTADANEA